MTPKTNVLFVSLGCDKNRVDSEEMLGHLAASGFSFTDDETEADVIVVNTCCFIDEAKEESIEAILDMAQMKTEGVCRKLVVAGCLAERYQHHRERIGQEQCRTVGQPGVTERLPAHDISHQQGDKKESCPSEVRYSGLLD